MDTSQTQVYIIIIIAISVIGIIMLYFLILVIRQQRKYQERFTKDIETEIITLENERKRISADLHDDLGPILSATKMKLNCIENIDAENNEYLSKGILYIDNMMNRIREISKGLMPISLAKKGTVYAIRDFIDTLEMTTPDIRLTCKEIPSIPDDKGIHIFRIIQEIVHNTIKHANASKLIIELSYDQKNLVIRIADDGKGFDYFRSLDHSAGNGLKNIKSRIHILNGDFHVKSAYNEGTNYYILIPY